MVLHFSFRFLSYNMFYLLVLVFVFNRRDVPERTRMWLLDQHKYILAHKWYYILVLGSCEITTFTF